MVARVGSVIWFLCSVSCSPDRPPEADTPALAATTPAPSAHTPAVAPTMSARSADTAATVRGQASAASEPPGQNVRGMANPLLAAIRDTLRARNAAIGSVGILEQRSLLYIGPSIVIGYGIRPDGRFQGSFQDELFGIFVANDSLTRILKTLEIFPTPRWRDYSFRISRLTADSVKIEGAGATYGDDPLVRAYLWPAPDSVLPPA